MMTPKKWAIFGGTLVVVGAGVFGLNFGGKETGAAQHPTTGSAPAAMAGPPMSAPDAGHEVKMLVKELEKKPGHVPILLRLAQISADAGKWDEAERRVTEALKEEPANIDARLELGRILYQRGDVQGAIRETARVVESDPGHVDALYNLGAIYGNLGDRRRALEYWKRASGAAPDSDSAKRAKQGMAQLGGG